MKKRFITSGPDLDIWDIFGMLKIKRSIMMNDVDAKIDELQNSHGIIGVIHFVLSSLEHDITCWHIKDKYYAQVSLA